MSPFRPGPGGRMDAPRSDQAAQRINRTCERNVPDTPRRQPSIGPPNTLTQVGATP
jgi:hypothetical protein